MNTFENFIESEAFFPVLILLLLMLIGVFVWIILSNKKVEKQRREKKKNIKIDESSEIKIFADSLDHTPKKPKVEEVEEPERTEIAIVEEVNVNKKRNIFDYEADLNRSNASDSKVEETNQEPEVKEKYSAFNSDGKNRIPVPEIFKPADGEEPMEEPDNAFNQIPNENHDINEDVKVEESQEYTSEKTEIFDFPAFKEEDVSNDNDVEDAIINAANEYIKNIMGKRD